MDRLVRWIFTLQGQKESIEYFNKIMNKNLHKDSEIIDIRLPENYAETANDKVVNVRIVLSIHSHQKKFFIELCSHDGIRLIENDQSHFAVKFLRKTSPVGGYIFGSGIASSALVYHGAYDAFLPTVFSPQNITIVTIAALLGMFVDYYVHREKTSVIFHEPNFY
jgi:hypothetical protein